MIYKVKISRRARKELKKFPKNIEKKLIIKAFSLGENPRPPGSIKLANTQHTYRIRIGVYRLIYEIQEEKILILVLRMGHRRDIYR